MESKFLTVSTSWTCSLHVIDIDICSAKTSGRRNAMLKTCSKVTETEKLKTVPQKYLDNRPKVIEQSARKTAIQVHLFIGALFMVLEKILILKDKPQRNHRCQTNHRSKWAWPHWPDGPIAPQSAAFRRSKHPHTPLAEVFQ